MISLSDQIDGMKRLDEAFKEYQLKNDFVCTDILYERGFQFLKEIVGMPKLIEISLNTSGTKDNVRKAQILYLFENEFTQK